MNADTNCRKCNTPMNAPPDDKDVFGQFKLTITGFRCKKCGHWNDLKRRKPKVVPKP